MVKHPKYDYFFNNISFSVTNTFVIINSSELHNVRRIIVITFRK